MMVCAGLATPFTHHPEAVITIGNGVLLNGTRLGAAKSITVGSKSILADCRIMDTDFHSLRKERDPKDAPVEVSPVHIHSNVWIGAQAAVLKGVTIGENSVVGFGAVVTSDIAPNMIAVGNPAKVVRRILINKRVCPMNSLGKTEAVNN
jgi:maltose O-acetyltransferase